MKIRSITYFCNPGWPWETGALTKAGEFIAAARPAFEAAGFEVQTTRLATAPFPDVMPDLQTSTLLQWARTLEDSAQEMGIEYVSLGPALTHVPQSYEMIHDVIAGTENIFLSGMMTNHHGQVSLPSVRACAKIIHSVAALSADGFANLRFAALANVPAGAPFFPAAYHNGNRPTFALAMEAADLAVEAFTNSPSLQQARQALIESIEANALSLETVSRELSRRFAAEVGGIDFTLAPYPEELRSIGTAMELLGVPSVGSFGSLAAAAILTHTLDQARFKRAGFNGLMLPALEDAVLAARVAEGSLSIKDLLLYSAICGTGLDTIPLPGDTSADQIYAVLLDLATLATRLDKPLTARLMPIPGKVAGDPTGFDFSYFANSRVMEIDAAPLRGHLSGQEDITIEPR